MKYAVALVVFLVLVANPMSINAIFNGIAKLSSSMPCGQGATGGK